VQFKIVLMEINKGTRVFSIKNSFIDHIIKMESGISDENETGIKSCA